MNRLALALVHTFRNHFYAPLDQNIAEWLQMHEERGEVPSCRRGCSACCRQLAFISIAEGVVLAEVLISQELKAKRVKFRDAAEKIRAFLAPQIDRLRDPFLTPLSFFGVPCPLLTARGECGAYHNRPVVCRTHFVATPREMCDDPQSRLAYLNFVDLAHAAHGWIDEHARQLGLPTVHVPVPVAVRLGLEFLERGPTGFATWLKTADPVLRPGGWLNFLLRRPRTLLPVVR